MRRILSLAAFSLLALSSTAAAQRGSMMVNPSPELGVDAGLAFTLDSPRFTVFSFPIQGVRAGFFVSPEISIEPALRINSISGGGETFTEYGLDVGLLYHFSTNRAYNQFYVRPFIGVDGTSGGGSSSSGFTFGGGFGIKVPINNRFATRYEANIARRSESGESQSRIGLLAGLSVYTR